MTCKSLEAKSLNGQTLKLLKLDLKRRYAVPTRPVITKDVGVLLLHTHAVQEYPRSIAEVEFWFARQGLLSPGA